MSGNSKRNIYSIIPVKIETKYDHEYMNNELIQFDSTGPRDVLVNGTINIIKQFPPEARTKIAVQKEDGKKYVAVGPPLERNICDFIKNEKMIYPDVLNYSNFPKSCPIEAKEYHNIYSIVFRNVTTEPNEEFFTAVFVNLHTLDNGKVVGDLNATLIKNYPPDGAIKISIARIINGKLVALGKPIQSNVCEFIRNDKLFYPSLQKHGNFPTRCPVLAKEYYLKNYILPTDNLPPVLPTGVFHADVLLFTKSVELGKIKIIGEILKNGNGVESSERASAGLGCIINGNLEQSITDWNCINERLMTLKVDDHDKLSVSLMVVYGSNEDENYTIKEDFWAAVQLEYERLEGPTYEI
ncbi:Chemosensory protein A 7a [Carabus blaptoides fortunei]